MKTYKLEYYGKTYDLAPIIGEYSYGKRLAIRLVDVNDDNTPFAILTVNIPEENLKNKNCAFVDNNNFPLCLRFICENKLGKPTNRIGISGYCVYPEIEFDLDKLNEDSEND